MVRVDRRGIALRIGEVNPVDLAMTKRKTSEMWLFKKRLLVPNDLELDTLEVSRHLLQLMKSLQNEYVELLPQNHWN